MRRLFGLLSLVLAASVVASLVVAVAAGAGEHGVPFHAQITLVSLSNTGPIARCGSDPNVGYTSTYTGTGTHLGRITATETVCLDFAHFVVPNLPYTVYETFQAANGDTLILVDTGNFNVATMAFTDGVFAVTGGTGRFLHAHGGGSTVLSVDSDGSGHVTGVAYTGTLFYDASDRSG